MAERTGPTVPAWLNTIMRLILRSPLHGLVSSKLMLISFRGRKSGRTFTTPVSYMQTGRSITLFTHAEWWRNLVGGSTVTLRIKGKKLEATTETIAEDNEAVAKELAVYLIDNHFDAKYYGVHYESDGRPNADDVRRGAEGVVMVRFRTA